MANSCGNLDSLTKFLFDSNKSPALNDGIKFKDYQKKFARGSKKTFYNMLYDSGYIKEGFEPITTSTTSNEPPPPENVLATTSNEIVYQNIITDAEKRQIDELREQYMQKLNRFQELTDQINQTSNNYLKRVNNNPYLGRYIAFTTGHCCYVTNQGVVKYIGNMDIWYSIEGKNDCPLISTLWFVNVPWLDEYWTPGTYIPALNLITGTNMQPGQSCGNAGKNVYTNTLVNNPIEKYEGCFNDIPPVTYIEFVPVMNSSNNVNGFESTASSIYVANDSFGPWAAFDNNTDTYWHGRSYQYNSSTGEYLGSYFKNYRDANGNNVEVRGEWLSISFYNMQGIALAKYDIQGRQNCCGNPNGRSPNSWVILGYISSSNTLELVDKRENEGLDYESKTYFINNPEKYKKYNQYFFLTTNCGNPNNKSGHRDCVQISKWKLYTSPDLTDDQRAMTWNESIAGYTDLESCKKYALNNGWNYFGLQNGLSDGTAACLVSNDLAMSSERYGPAYTYTFPVIWAADVQGSNMATLTRQGSLSVLNSGGASIYATPSSKATDYIGTYGDSIGYKWSITRSNNNSWGWWWGWTWIRVPTSNTMILQNDGSQTYNYDTCHKAAIDQKALYFGLQNSTTGNNAKCSLSGDINSITSLGKANNQTDIGNGKFSGGESSNSVYAVGSNLGNYYLILQDDGNMCIYRGMSPDDNQGLIWTPPSKRNEKKEANPAYAASKGKYGKNWMPAGSTLAAGEFIGSNDGSMFLIMQTDGNLVLYTNEKTSACSTTSKGYKVGGQGINALYSVSPPPFKQNVGKAGYVDEENVLHEYDSSNLKLTNNYTKFEKSDAYGNDIPGAMYGNANIEGCKSTCDNNKDCYGFVFDNTNKVCWPKTSEAWPNGGKFRSLSYLDTYVRGKEPITLPSGASKDIVNIDSVQYQYYLKGNRPDGKYGLANATSAQQQELDQLQNDMRDLANQVASITGNFGEGTDNAQGQSSINTASIDQSLAEQQATENKIANSNSVSTSATTPSTRPITETFKTNDNLDRFLKDSDIVVLQKNYDYLFWSILAAGSVVVAMNIKPS